LIAPAAEALLSQDRFWLPDTDPQPEAIFEETSLRLA
jgi:hypothetical protein